MAIAPSPPSKQQFISLLQAILRDVKALDDVSFESFLAGDLKIAVVPDAGSKAGRPVTTFSEEQVALLKESLEDVDTRAHAKELIGSALRTKRDMVQFARCLDIPLSSRATSAEMMSRLVEATVGYRLRSAAIRSRETVHTKVDVDYGPEPPPALGR